MYNRIKIFRNTFNIGGIKLVLKITSYYLKKLKKKLNKWTDLTCVLALENLICLKWQYSQMNVWIQ